MVRSEERARELVREAIRHYLLRYQGYLPEAPEDLLALYVEGKLPAKELHAAFLSWVRRQVLWGPVRVFELSPVQPLTGTPCPLREECAGDTIAFAREPLPTPLVATFYRGVRFTGARPGLPPPFPLEPERGDGVFLLSDKGRPGLAVATRDPTPGRGEPRWLLPLFWVGNGELFELERFYLELTSKGLYPWPISARALAYATAQIGSVLLRAGSVPRESVLLSADGASLILL